MECYRCGRVFLELFTEIREPSASYRVCKDYYLEHSVGGESRKVRERDVEDSLEEHLAISRRGHLLLIVKND